MENIEFEFIDRAISMIKENYKNDAIILIAQECGLNIVEARVFIQYLIQIMGDS